MPSCIEETAKLQCTYMYSTSMIQSQHSYCDTMQRAGDGHFSFKKMCIKVGKTVDMYILHGTNQPFMAF